MIPELSICIPTFNRAHYLGQLLDSLAAQIDPGVEVVISDNASTDGTPEIVEKRRNVIPRLTYLRWNENRGADQNYLSAVEMASGQYCWLMGSDDIAVEDAIKNIRSAIARKPDCLLFGRQLRTKEMELIENQSYWSFHGERWFDFSKEPFSRYLEQSTSICALFSYLSSIVFKRELWARDEMKQRLLGSAYAHADILIRQLAAGGTLLASDTTVVRCRCGNDSFSDGNKGRRLALDFDGYEQISAIFPSATDRSGVMRILLREHPWRNLIHVIRHKASLGLTPRNNFTKRLNQLGVSGTRIDVYCFLARSPWFEIFEFIEPLFKKNSPLARMRRGAVRLFASCKLEA